ncbi:hypothetical protein YC2023_006969 [Brassica napus]
MASILLDCGRQRHAIFIFFARINYFLSLSSSSYSFSNYSGQKICSQIWNTSFIEKSSHGSMLYTAVKTNSVAIRELLEGDDSHGNRVYTDISASGKGNDVNNVKRIKAYMDKVELEHSNICVDIM